MTLEEIKNKITEDPDFIGLKRFDYSLAKLLKRYEDNPEGCPDRVIAHALMISEEEVELLYQRSISRLRKLMGVK